MKTLLMPLLRFVFHIGYFGPLVMGALDSSFLILPFGNDLVVVGLVAQHHDQAAWYILSAACGSTLGALVLALVARKAGDEGLRRITGEKRYESLRTRIKSHAVLAVAVGGLAPPPFPFTTVIAVVAALQYPLWRILTVNFVARMARFTILALLALRFGRQVMQIARSAPFEWSMMIFILFCLIASAFSIWRWVKKPAERAHQATPLRAN